jgi:hypothetical protein
MVTIKPSPGQVCRYGKDGRVKSDEFTGFAHKIKGISKAGTCCSWEPKWVFSAVSMEEELVQDDNIPGLRL